MLAVSWLLLILHVGYCLVATILHADCYWVATKLHVGCYLLAAILHVGCYMIYMLHLCHDQGKKVPGSASSCPQSGG